MGTHTGGLLATGTAAAVLLFCGGPVLQGQDARQQPPEFRSGVELVTVDVGVVDRQGQPLRGLGAGDFTVTVAGRPRRVVSAEFVDATPPRRDEGVQLDSGAVSTNEGGGTGRLFVFVVDQSTLDTGSVRRVAGAASRFLEQLTFADRSALVLLPVGEGVGFTWAHDRVRDGLRHASGLAQASLSWEYGSLGEARDIANRGQFALRTVAERECGGSILAADNLSGPVPPGGNTRPGGESTPSGTGGSPAGGSGGGTATGGTSGGSGSSPARASSPARTDMNPCVRNLQMMAESAWRSAHLTSLASLSGMRQVISDLQRVRGDKTIILISGGWPLDEREETSLLSTVARDAAAARATLFTLFISASTFSVERRSMSPTPGGDMYLHQGPLENLAAMTGGGSFRADVGAEGVFDRLSRELAGYYRIGIERDPSDAAGKAREMKVRVARGGLTVRAREFFDVRTYEDRDWAARVDAALESPAPATGVGLRVTSYLAADQGSAGQVKLVLAGEASRMQPGPASLEIVVRDLQGRKVLQGDQPLGEATADVLPFSANLGVVPGSYIVRLAVLDGEGRVGSVDHRVDVKPTTVAGNVSALGPVLIRVPSATGAEPRIALDAVEQDERLAMQVDLEGEQDRLRTTSVAFEISATAGGPALVHAEAPLTPGTREGSAVAQALADMRLLPPGPYVVRAKFTSSGDASGEVRRAFVVSGAAATAANAAVASGAEPRSLVVRVPSGAVQSFAVDQVLAPQVLGAFLDRVASRPDAASPATRELLEHARTGELSTLVVPDASPSDGPVPAFLQGLGLLAQNKLDPAANAFRTAMRASPDFYPAIVYLGACYAAGGNDKQAAGAWRTALIKEGDTAALHVWLADALLRQGRADEALETIEHARVQWPGDANLERRFVAGTLLAGRSAEGLQALDRLIAAKADDSPSLTFGLLVLYEAFVDRRPIESVETDRARMTRLAAAYRARGGPSQALVDTWLDAMKRN